MKHLILLGYAPAEKVAWPGGRLKDTLESLDPRHEVFPNLVMTPLLSTLCFVPAVERAALLDDFHRTSPTNHVRENVSNCPCGNGRHLLIG